MTESVTETKASLASASALFKESWSLYKNKFTLFVGIMLVPTLLSILSSALTPDIYVYGQGSAFTAIIVAVSLLVGLLFILVMIWGEASLIVALRDRVETISIEESYHRSATKIWAYLWVLILNAFIVAGGFLLFVVPGILFMFWFLFSLFIALAEKEKGMNALLKSREYIRGYWWAVFGRYLLIIFFSLFAFAIVQSVASLISFDSLWNAIVSAVFSLFFVPFVLAYLYLLYENLKSLKSTADIEINTSQKWVYLLSALAGYLFIIIILVVGVFFAAFGLVIGWLIGSNNFNFNSLINNLH